MRVIITCLALALGPCVIPQGNNACPEGERDILAKNPDHTICVDQRMK